jgi:hypothetical protein
MTARRGKGAEIGPDPRAGSDARIARPQVTAGDSLAD